LYAAQGKGFDGITGHESLLVDGLFIFIAETAQYEIDLSATWEVVTNAEA